MQHEETQSGPQKPLARKRWAIRFAPMKATIMKFTQTAATPVTWVAIGIIFGWLVQLLKNL